MSSFNVFEIPSFWATWSKPKAYPCVFVLQTNWEGSSVALHHEGKIFSLHAGKEIHNGFDETQSLKLVDLLLRKTGVNSKFIEAIAFDAGPGPFTSLRSTCSIAQGLAYGWKLPVIAVSSLQAISWERHVRKQFLQGSAQQVKSLPVLDARMKEIYYCQDIWFANNETIEIQSDISPTLIEPARLFEQTKFQTECLCGPGVIAYAENFSDFLPNLDISDERWQASTVGALAELAVIQWLNDQNCAQAPENSSPIYVRNNVALTLDEQKKSKS